MKKTYEIVSVEDAIRIKARGLRREHLEIYIAGREKRVEPYWRAREQVHAVEHDTVELMTTRGTEIPGITYEGIRDAIREKLTDDKDLLIQLSSDDDALIIHCPRDRQADKSLVIEAVLRSLGYVRREGDEE